MVNVYQAFFSLKPGIKDLDFVRALEAYMSYLQQANGGNDLRSWRLLRRKLGLGPKELGDFHLMMEFDGLAELDRLFQHVATRQGEVEEKHFCVNHMIDSVTFCLYRDFPDPTRQNGGELF